MEKISLAKLNIGKYSYGQLRITDSLPLVNGLLLQLWRKTRVMHSL